MKLQTKLCMTVCALALMAASSNALAHDNKTTDPRSGPLGHAPIGVMGDHMHDQGEFMLSYRYMTMDMDGNRIGSDSVTPEEIVTTIPNPFGSMPANLRVVPTEMRMDMHMFGAMYAPTDWLTGMVMVNYLYKEMDHITFDTGMGTNRVGTFTTATSGFGDTRLSGLIRLFEDDIHHLHLNAGLSLPTGSITEEDDVLAPNLMTPRFRLPYAMQLGSGTFDAHPGMTYYGLNGRWGWGAQYTGEIRLENENDEGYALGDKHAVTAWGAYQWQDWVSTSLRLSASTQDAIDGRDMRIMAPVQTADPDNYGGEVVTAGLGANFYVTEGYLKGHRLAAEAEFPIHRDLNGPQMETDMVLTFGWQKSF